MTNENTPLDLNDTHVDSLENVIFQEQRMPTVEDARVTKSHTVNQLKNATSMPETAWSVRDILSRPVQLGTYTWNTTQPVGTEIVSFDFPGILTTLTSQPVYQILSTFAFFSGSVRFRFQLNSTKFHIGRLVAALNPMRRLSDDQINIFTASGLPNVKIDASESTLAELLIPFTHLQSFLTTNTNSLYDTLARVHVVVFNQLSVAPSTLPALSLSVYAHMEVPEVQVPIYSHTPILVAQGIIEDFLPSGISGGISKVISGATSAVSNVAKGDFGEAVASAGAGLGGLVSIAQKLFDFDMPTFPIPEHGRITKFSSTLAHGTSRFDFDTRLSLDPVSMAPPYDEITGTLGNEMDLNVITSVPMLLVQCKWLSTQTPGTRITPPATGPTLLQGFTVCPSLCSTIASATSDSPVTFFPTYLSYVSQRFARWRGSIKFRFEFICSQFHSGRLLVGFVPGDTSSVPTLQQAQACTHTVFDLQEAHEFDLEIPYVASTPFKESVFAASVQNDLHLIGTMFIYVLTSLVSPSNVSPDIDINMFISGGDDFELAVPYGLQTDSNPVDNIYLPPSGTPIVAQGPEINVSRSSNTPQPPTLMKGQSTVKQASVGMFGEDFMSLKTVLRRFSPLFDVATPTGTLCPILRVPVTPYLSDSNSDTDCSFYSSNLLNYFSRIFVFWKGSIRYRFLSPYSQETDGLISHLVNKHERLVIADNAHSPAWSFEQLQDTEAIGTALAYNQLNYDPSLEIETPWYSPFLQNLIDAHDTALDNHLFTNGTLRYTRSLPEETVTYPIRLRVFQAAGDDFQFNYLIPPPTIYMKQPS